MWESVVRSGDTVVDATCGNGHDSQKLASLLFAGTPGDREIGGRLICIDVQETAIKNTREGLSAYFREMGLDIPLDVPLDEAIRERSESVPSSPTDRSRTPSVTMICGSHDTSFPRSIEDVGIVVYNLGFLPGTENKEVQTSAASTLSSLSQAAASLRIGGALSVIVYPGSNPDEDRCVRLFCEALSYLSSKEGLTEKRVENMFDGLRERVGLENDGVVRCAVQAVMDGHDGRRGWRVYDHNPVGRTTSPALITAIRIK